MGDKITYWNLFWEGHTNKYDKTSKLFWCYYLLSDFKYNLEISTKFRPFQNISTLQRWEIEISLCPTLNLKPQNWKYLGMQQLQSSHHLPGHTKRHFLLRPQHFSHVICIPPLLLAKTMLLPFHRIFDLVLLYLY